MLSDYRLPPVGRPLRRLLPPPDFTPPFTEEDTNGIATDTTES